MTHFSKRKGLFGYQISALHKDSPKRALFELMKFEVLKPDITNFKRQTKFEPEYQYLYQQIKNHTPIPRR